MKSQHVLTTAVIIILLLLSFFGGRYSVSRAALPDEVVILKTDTVWRTEVIEIQSAPEVVEIQGPTQIDERIIFVESVDPLDDPSPEVQRIYSDTTDTETGRVWYWAAVRGKLDSIRLGYELNPIEIQTPTVVQQVAPRWQVDGSASVITTGQILAGATLRMPKVSVGLQASLTEREYMATVHIPLWRKKQR